jgi:hypothetical protein
VRPAFTVFHQAACGLKGPNGSHRVRVVDLGVARCWKTGSGESAVEVANRASLIARTQRQALIGHRPEAIGLQCTRPEV